MPSRRRKNKLTRWILSLVIAALAVAGAYIGYRWAAYKKAKSTHYREFGITIPDEYSIHGIDVSRYQHLIAWEEVKKMQVDRIRLSFAFIKATEGIGNTDPQFHRNWKKAQSSGIIRGAYHFFIATRDGKAQAEQFIRKVELETGDLPPVLDVEQRYGATKAQLQREVKKWLETVEQYYGITPVIYTNVDFYNQYLGNAFDKYPLWIAHYYEPQRPRIGRDWLFWQHSDQGNVNGITAKVDFNVFNGDSLDFRGLLVP
ncbi:MAG: GH25 family lysozyme [Chitinophagaceae bacterium]